MRKRRTETMQSRGTRAKKKKSAHSRPACHCKCAAVKQQTNGKGIKKIDGALHKSDFSRKCDSHHVRWTYCNKRGSGESWERSRTRKKASLIEISITLRRQKAAEWGRSSGQKKAKVKKRFSAGKKDNPSGLTSER